MQVFIMHVNLILFSILNCQFDDLDIICKYKHVQGNSKVDHDYLKNYVII